MIVERLGVRRPRSYHKPGLLPFGPIYLNKNHRYAKNLVAWWPTIAAGGKVQEIIGGQHATLTGASLESNARFYYELDGSGSTDRASVGTGVWNSTGPVTWSFWNYVANSSIYRANGGYGTSSSTDRLSVNAPWNDGNLYWDYGDTSTGRLSASYSGYTGKWTHIILQSHGSGGAGMAIWLDGVKVATKGSSDGPNGTIDFDLLMAFTYYHQGKIADMKLFNAFLDDSGCVELYRDGYRYFESAYPPISFSTGGTSTHTSTGAITLSLIEASGAGAVARDSTGALSMPGVLADGVAERALTGTGSLTLVNLTLDGTAGKSIAGTGAATLPAITASGSASGPPITGTGALSLPAITVGGSAGFFWIPISSASSNWTEISTTSIWTEISPSTSTWHEE